MEHGIKNCYYADTVMFACLARILLVYPYLISTKHCGCPMARSQGFTNFVTLTAAVLTLIAALIGLRAVLIQTERIYNPTPIPTLQIAAVTEISSETPRPTESSTPTQTLEPTITDTVAGLSLTSPPGTLSKYWRRGEKRILKSPLHAMGRGFRGGVNA